MSRTIRRELFSILETLKEANQILENLLHTDDGETLIELLTDCQECAVAIGNQIEEIYGNNLVCIRGLEDYCEAVYQMASSEEKTERAEIYFLALQKLKETETAMEQEIPDKQEVVFFPYKASMWDSLESVYLAAKEDEDCEAYCVPIPYFDRKRDGSLGEMHYEGGEYPANIEVTDWEQYDFEKRRPDVIYIHNPYDASNFVTCVHPKYFSSNLKKYTEKLVYIPYFVLGEIEPDDQAAIDGMKHFCFLPGVIYADRVIVQSEKMKQIYVNEYLKAAQEAGLPADRKQLEEKILGLGSPKLDKVLNTKKEDLDIPEEWMRIIQKPDGSWKKVIFYNTSINAMLENNEKMLDKIEDVFRIFKENQDEVALLWRPHPLLTNTIQSMRPQLWERYREIVERYRSEDWGIYDDTADLDRAVVLSDAYYGDWSSVVQLFQKMEKIIMVQNPKKQNKFFVQNDQMYQDGNKYWFVGRQNNVLYSMDIETGKIRRIISIPTENGDTFRINPRCIKYRNKIFCLPDRGNCIWIYDLLNLHMEKLNIFNPQKVRICISDFWVCDNILWCISYGLSQIVEINLLEEKIINYYDIFCDKGEGVGIKSEKVNNIIYCVSRKSKTIVEFDIVTKNIVRKHVSMLPKEGFNTITYDGKKFWLSGYKDIYVWDRNRIVNVIKCRNKTGTNNDEIAPLFCNSVAVKNAVFFIPWNICDNKIVFIQTDSQKMNYLDFDLEEEDYVIEYIRDKRYLNVGCWINGEIVEVDERGCSIRKQEMNLDDRSFKMMLNWELDKYGDSIPLLLKHLGG